MYEQDQSQKRQQQQLQPHIQLSPQLYHIFPLALRMRQACHQMLLSFNTPTQIILENGQCAELLRSLCRISPFSRSICFFSFPTHAILCTQNTDPALLRKRLTKPRFTLLCCFKKLRKSNSKMETQMGLIFNILTRQIRFNQQRELQHGRRPTGFKETNKQKLSAGFLRSYERTVLVIM